MATSSLYREDGVFSVHGCLTDTVPQLSWCDALKERQTCSSQEGTSVCLWHTAASCTDTRGQVDELDARRYLDLVFAILLKLVAVAVPLFIFNGK